MKKLNVLLFPAGTEIGLEIFHALKNVKNIRLFAAGQDVSNHARHLFRDYHVIPSIHEIGWAEQLNRLCERAHIDYVFPCHDDALVALAEEYDAISARVVAPVAETCRITRSKRATYGQLKEAIKVPFVFSDPDSISTYPVFVKPDRGQGSFGTSLVRMRGQLQAALDLAPDPVICEFLPGSEFTVDCISDGKGRVVYAQARQRGRMRNGIAVNTFSCDLPYAMEWATAIAGNLPMKGAWFFQIKEDTQGRPTLLEIAPRIAGSMALHRVRGVNFPLLSILAHEGTPFSVSDNMVHMEMDRALSNRYAHKITYSAIYMDLDDTLIINNQVNDEAIRLIYQCINDGKSVHLITRHAGDLQATLARWRLTQLFDQIIHIIDGSPKSTYMTLPGAILIDDSFAERADAQKHGILAFDPSMIECLANTKQYHP